jgi:streptogramin lyase
MRDLKAAALIGVGLALALPVLAQAKAGDIIIGADGYGTVNRLTPDGSTLSEIASGDPIDSPGGLDFAADGTLYFADYNLPGVIAVNPKTGDADVVSNDTDFFSEPLDLDVGPDKQIYVAEETNGTVLRVDPKTGAATELGAGFDFDFPYSVTVLPNRQIYVADDDRILNINPRTDAVSTVVEIPGACFCGGLEQTARRTLIATDDGNATIYEVNPRTKSFDPLSSGGFLNGFYNPGIESKGTIIIGETSDERIIRINPKTGDQSYVGPDLTDLDVFPEGITVEPPKCTGKTSTIPGSTKKDKLKGSKFGDVIAALKGKDKITGGKGRDRICGGSGKDKVKAADRKRDKVNCGSGKDKATVDEKDKVARNCETVKVR